MKTLILIYLASQMLTVTPATTIPTVDGTLALYPSNSTLLLAHSYLAGTHLYDLREGDAVTAIYSDGTTQEYTVSQVDAFAARYSPDAISGYDFMMRWNDDWRMLSDVLPDYQSAESITLMTCYAGHKGFDVVTGRLFVELVPVENNQR